MSTSSAEVDEYSSPYIPLYDLLYKSLYFLDSLTHRQEYLEGASRYTFPASVSQQYLPSIELYCVEESSTRFYDLHMGEWLGVYVD